MSGSPPGGVELRLRLFGSPLAEDAAGRAVPGLGPGKPLALLCYLARNADARRDELASLLWGDVDEARARNAFRQSLHRLRGALDGLLLQTQDRVSLDRAGDLWIDVSAFEAALAEGQYEEAFTLYRGDFLDGFSVGEPAFDHWADRERTLLRGRFQSVAESTIRQALADGRTDVALRFSARLCEVAPFESGAALLRATALVGAGMRTEAASSLRAFASRLSLDLGLEPPVEVQEALTRLGADAPRAPRMRPAERVATAHAQESPAAKAPLVGRSLELARLLGAWQRVKQGAGVSVVVEGDAGAGKTRLLDEFAATLRALDDPVILRGSERTSGPHLPYAPVAEALRGALRAPGLAGASEHLLAEAARLLPELRDRFRLPAAEPVDDDVSRLRFFEGIAAVVEAVAYETPVCIILDDLGRTAAATRELVAYLAARLQGAAVMLVISRVPSGAEQEDDEAYASFAGEVVRVSPLGAEDAMAFVSALPTASLSGEDRERVVAFGAGNPLRLIELAGRADRGEPLTAPLAGLHDILWAKLEAQPAAHRRLFLAAALLGRPASLRLLAAAAHLPEAATLDGALALERAGLFVQSGAGIGTAHAVAANLAVERSGAAARALLAGWVADALVAYEEAPPAALAELYASAGRVDDAYRHALLAAADAERLGAWTDAIAWLHMAAQVAPDEDARAAAERRLEALGAGRGRLLAGAAGASATMRPAQPRPARRRISPLVIGALVVLVVVAVALSLARSARTRPVGHVLRDSVVLLETTAPGQSARFAATGAVAEAFRNLVDIAPRRVGPSWVDSLNVPWMNPRPAPGGGFVAVERMTAGGPDLYLISGDRADTIAVARGGGDDVALGWSPDGRWLLLSRSRDRSDGSYDTDLYAYELAAGTLLPLDTLSDHEVVEARWSPDGAHIAWTARVGPQDQQEIFVSRADGSAVQNLSRHPAEDYQPTWGPDGTRIAFTSERNGNAEIYAVEVPGGQLTRITFDDAQDDRPAFSPDNRFLAFESTRGGEPGVYVVASRGGEPARLSPPTRRMTLGGWRGAAPPYIERVRIAAPVQLIPGDSARVRAEALRSDGTTASVSDVEWTLLDQTLARVTRNSAEEATMSGLAPGLARIVLRIPGWRTDTSFVKIGAQPVLALREDFERDIGTAASAASPLRWLPFGAPPPDIRAGSGTAGSLGLVPRTSRNTQSGLLSARAFPLLYGLSTRVALRAPFSASRAGSAMVALVSPDAAAAMNPRAPSFLPLASVSWIGEAGRIAYAVEREAFTEPVSALAPGDEHVVEIRVEADGRVAFFVDGTQRWRSTLRLADNDPVSQVQLWLGGQSGDAEVAIDDAEVWVGEVRN